MKGILFRPEMIRSIVIGSKVMTRRVIKPQPELTISDDVFKHNIRIAPHLFKSRYQVGEVIYIKETLRIVKGDGNPNDFGVVYLGQGTKSIPEEYRWWRDNGEMFIYPLQETGWISPLFMPAWAARYFIKIKDVRAERLQEITEEDARAEGVEAYGSYQTTTWIQPYKKLWDTINKPPYDWQSNCWVWRYEFQFTPPINQSSEGEG